VSRNLRALGAFLSEAARRSDVFEERLRVLQWEWLAWRIAEGERRLRDAPEAGPFWKDGVKAYVAALRLAMTGPDLAIASDLAAVYGRAGARATFRRIVRGFGELLAAWPDMVAAARELEESDAASARRVTA